MFNFKELKLNKEVNESDPFVGIRRSKSGEMEFRLPRGFIDFPENDFNETKTFFFRMYRTFKKFERDHSGRYIDKNQGRRDNIEKAHDGYSFLDSEGSEVVLYSKISVIESLLEAYEDLSLDVIERQIGIDEKIDYSKIDKYLDKAIYQEENIDEYVIYIDSMELPRNVIQYKSATLIDMFCFILHEVNNELDEGTDSRVRELSSKFKEEHLSCDQSLFQEDTFEETIIILKDLLQNIDKATVYKDNDYWRLYEAIESFLYGELDMNNPHLDGVFWGISNFYQIWEDMCNTYMFSNNYDIIYADTNIKLKNKNKCFSDQFFIKFRNKKRYLKPDLIYKITIFEIAENFINIKKKSAIDINFSILPEKIPERGNIQELLFNHFKIKNKKGYRSNSGTKCNDIIHFSKYPINEFLHRKNKVLEIKILDYKYLDHIVVNKKTVKIDIDISKQLCYEYSLGQLEDYNNILITSQFILPFFDKASKDIGHKMNENELYQRLVNEKIEVFKANFYTMQDAYLNYD